MAAQLEKERKIANMDLGVALPITNLLGSITIRHEIMTKLPKIIKLELRGMFRHIPFTNNTGK